MQRWVCYTLVSFLVTDTSIISPMLQGLTKIRHACLARNKEQLLMINEYGVWLRFEVTIEIAVGIEVALAVSR